MLQLLQFFIILRAKSIAFLVKIFYNISVEIKKIKIGNVCLKNNVFLAPMAGFTDMAFRFVCHNFGAGLTETEMVSAKALYYDNDKTKELLKFEKQEKPKAVQIFGHEPEIISKVISSGVLDDFDIIDINMGCPAPKIFNNGDGCALMKNANLAADIIKAAKKSTKKPIMVKFRAGVDDKHINCVEFAKVCEEAGADAIIVHPRTREQYYSGNADWSLIKKIKENSKIPVVANGDIKSKEDAIKCFAETNADAIMIGRASLGNPYIFSEIAGKKVAKTKGEVLLKIIDILKKNYNSGYALGQIRAHLVHFLKNEEGAAKEKVAILKLENIDEIEKEVKEFFNLK